MSRYLALEWDETEARVVVASLLGVRPVIERAFAVPLGAPSADGEGREVDPGEQIASGLAAWGVGRADTLVAIGRASIELRELSVPPAPDDELPDMVRFQALREFNAMEEDWPLDFVPIREAPGEERTVLAAAIAPEMVRQIRATCHIAGLKPRRLILRPFGAASLLARSQPGQPVGARLLIDLLGEETDLTAMADGHVIFLRTARLPGDPLTSDEAAGALMGETRRTMAAVHNQLGGRRVESIVLFGAGGAQDRLAAAIEEQLQTATEVFDPLAQLTLGRDLKKALPDHPGRFAPLLGILLDELDETPPAIDFLHPRRRPEPPSRRNLYAGIGLAAAGVVLLVLLLGWMHRSSIAEDIRRLRAESNRLQKQVSRAQKMVQAAKEIEAWTDQETIWLDELRWLSERFPSAEEAMLTQLELNPSQGQAGAKMQMEGLARNATTLKAMDQVLEDQSHQVVGEGAGASGASPRYSTRFDRAVILGKGKK